VSRVTSEISSMRFWASPKLNGSVIAGAQVDGGGETRCGCAEKMLYPCLGAPLPPRRELDLLRGSCGERVVYHIPEQRAVKCVRLSCE